jgi:Tfp pilus assembly protein PilF
MSLLNALFCTVSYALTPLASGNADARPPEPAVVATTPAPADSPFTESLKRAEGAFAQGDATAAGVYIRQALERDPRSRAAWALRARMAETAGDVDERIWCLHHHYRLALAQKASKTELELLRKELVAIDPLAKGLLDLGRTTIDKLRVLAADLEKDKRPHSAIRVWKQVLALDPERGDAQDAIQRIASVPDPSLAGEAKPKDLLAGISEEWIRDFDKKHFDWDHAAEFEKPNYVTKTSAGYAVMIRAAEAMEQMNAFYRRFFRYGAEGDNRTPSRIQLRLFKNRDEYLKKGSSPVEWSAGQFTGDAVETYADQGGFEGLMGVLFHEAAHQFVSLATTAEGWLNEGLASFFEGTRVLNNGTVIFNLPANHRLFPLVERMKNGWMSDHEDGIDPQKPETTPSKAPTFAIVLGNEYAWGPPWYAPTWGVVYFLYNYQDLEDGRFLYRNGFLTFIDKSAGRMGDGASQNFEEVVLAHPEPPTPGVEIPASKRVPQPQTVAELDEVWKTWMIEIADEQSGRRTVARPYRKWAGYALLRKDLATAEEHFEKGVQATPDDPELLMDFAKFLADQRANTDRASQLMNQAVRAIERQPKPDEKLLAQAEKLLDKLDPKRKSLGKILDEVTAESRAIAGSYLSSSLHLMAMETSWRLGMELKQPALLDIYADALRRSKRSIALWQLAYNESDLDGWSAAGSDSYQADKRVLRSDWKDDKGDEYAFRFLSLDKVTSGDFSLEAELLAQPGQVSFAGLVFGKKSDTTFHALIYFPSKTPQSSAYLDLASFYGATSKTWRHVGIAAPKDDDAHATGETWHKLRLDVTGTDIDMWVDGKLLPHHAFPSLDVVRGRFGLITGPGRAGFRNVRYLARPLGDPAGPIERTIKLESLPPEESAAADSYLERVPPFPKVQRWVQGSRATWNEKGYAPQLFVLWSIDQNTAIPIDGWLRGLHAKYAPLGLEIVSVASFLDEKALPAYLNEHKFPGAVGLDQQGTSAFGEIFELYSVQQHALPRLVLLDIDQKVVWEGDPGFKRGGPKAGEGSYLDAPLDELIAKRELRTLRAWIDTWDQTARPALHDGDLATALPVLQAAAKFDRKLAPPIADAQRALEQVDALLANPDALLELLPSAEAEACLPALVQWAEIATKPFAKGVLVRLKPLENAKSAQAWKKLVAATEAWKTRLSSPKAEERGAQLVQELESMPGCLPRELAAEARALQAQQDWPGMAALFDTLAARPARWFAREHFRW